MVVKLLVEPVLYFSGSAISFIFDKICTSLSLHKTINELRAEVNKVQRANKELRGENDRLQENTTKLREVENELEELSILQGQSVDVLLKQVREFKEIQENVKEHLEAKVIQNLISVVMHSDDDKDFVIDPEEIDGLILRLKAIDGVDFSEENFAKALRRSGYDPGSVNVKEGGYNIKVVLEVMKNLVDDDVPEKDCIFSIKTDRVLGGRDG